MEKIKNQQVNNVVENTSNENEMSFSEEAIIASEQDHEISNALKELSRLPPNTSPPAVDSRGVELSLIHI